MTTETRTVTTVRYSLDEDEVKEAIMFYLCHKKKIEFPSNVIVDKELECSGHGMFEYAQIQYNVVAESGEQPI